VSSPSFAILGSADLEYDGGGERNALQTSKIAKKMGFDVTIFGSGCEYERNNHIAVNEVNYVKNAFKFDIFGKKSILRLTHSKSTGLIGLFRFRRIYNIVKGYDYYYFQNPNFLFRNFSMYARKSSFTHHIILANHGSYFEILGQRNNPAYRLVLRFLNRLIFKSIDRSITVQVQNSFQYDFYRKMGFNNIHLIPQSSVNFDDFRVEESRGFNVVFLNKLTKNKGSKLLMKILKDSDEDIKFHIVGLDTKRYAKKIKKNNVIFYGQVSEEEKRNILAKSDVMINCSEYESLSISSIEGLASGLPIISTRTSGLVYIRDVMGENVIIIDRNTKDFLTEINRLRKLKEKDPMEYLMLRKKIKEKASLYFDVRIIEEAMKSMIGSMKLEREEVLFQ